MKKGDTIRAIKIFHDESQIKQGFPPEEIESLGGVVAIKRALDEVYSNEEKALEKIRTFNSGLIVRPLALIVSSLCRGSQ